MFIKVKLIDAKYDCDKNAVIIAFIAVGYKI